MRKDFGSKPWFYPMSVLGCPVRRLVLEGWPHGFGGDGDWVEDYAAWLEAVFAAS